MCQKAECVCFFQDYIWVLRDQARESCVLSILAGKKYRCKVLERDVHEVHGGGKRGGFRVMVLCKNKKRCLWNYISFQERDLCAKWWMQAGFAVLGTEILFPCDVLSSWLYQTDWCCYSQSVAESSSVWNKCYFLSASLDSLPQHHSDSRAHGWDFWGYSWIPGSRQLSEKQKKCFWDVFWVWFLTFQDSNYNLVPPTKA